MGNVCVIEYKPKIKTDVVANDTIAVNQTTNLRLLTNVK